MSNKTKLPPLSALIEESMAQEYSSRTPVIKAQKGIIVPVQKPRASVVREHNSLQDYSMTANMRYRKESPEEKAAQRQQRIQASVVARKIPWTRDNWRERMAAETAATEDKLSLQELPLIGKYVPDVLDVTGGIGHMASALGSAPLRAKREDSLLPYASAIGLPLAAGALGSIGTKNTAGFVNNMVNPLAGTGDLVKKVRDRLFNKIVKSPYGKKAKVLLPSGKPEFVPSNIEADKKIIPLEDDFWDDLGMEGEDKIVASRVKYDDLSNLMEKYGEKFTKKYGTKYTEEDLGLFAKMEAIDKERLQTQSNYSLRSDAELSDNFIGKHAISREYTPMDELLTDSYTRGYDSRMNNRAGKHSASVNTEFYKKEVSPKLEELIKKNKLKSTETLHRGESDYMVKNVWREGVLQPKSSIQYSQLQKGDVFKPGSFVSTSLSRSKANIFGGITSEITAPAGQSILFPNATGVKNFYGEKEALLPRKLKYRVDDVEDLLSSDGSRTVIKKLFKHSIVNPYTVAGAVAGKAYINENTK